MFSEDYSYKCILISIQAVVNTYLELVTEKSNVDGNVILNLFSSLADSTEANTISLIILSGKSRLSFRLGRNLSLFLKYI